MGVRPGMPVAAACAIANGLSCQPRDAELEQQSLKRIAAWCYQYSHQVCRPSDRAGLFLEAGASERLFGSAQEIGQRVHAELGEIGYHARIGSAATMEASWVAAHDARHVPCRGDIRQRFAPLPLHYLHLDAADLAAMTNMGLRQFKDLLRLPRKSLARRFGPGLPDYLDRLLGFQPDPRPFYKPCGTFSARLALTAETTNSQALMFSLRRLVDELCGVLRGADAAVQAVRISFGHERGPDTRLQLGLQSPGQSPARLLLVLRERLERLRLRAAVRDVRLEAPRFLPFKAGQEDLFPDLEGQGRHGIAELAERLQARLGKASISGITAVEDHRPERAWRRRELSEPVKCISLPHRPAWLLAEPRPCEIRDYEFLSGPERIETGWWDGRDCRRDYFVMRDGRGCRLWVFHEYKPRRGWYLHGIFS